MAEITALLAAAKATAILSEYDTKGPHKTKKFSKEERAARRHVRNVHLEGTIFRVFEQAPSIRDVR